MKAVSIAVGVKDVSFLIHADTSLPWNLDICCYIYCACEVINIATFTEQISCRVPLYNILTHIYLSQEKATL